MEQHASPNPPPPSAPAPALAPTASSPSQAPSPASPAPPDRAHWTPSRQRIFLSALLETGCVARAARAAGMSRSSAHRLRRRLAGTPFDHAWDQALLVHARRMADPFECAAPPGGQGRRADAPGRASSAAHPARP